MATVEAAIALGALVLVFAVVLGGLGAVLARIRCVDAAGEAARRASRDDLVGARALAEGLPQGTEVDVAVEGDVVRVRVRVPPLGGALPGFRVSADAVAAREPAVAGPTGTAADGAAEDGAPEDLEPDDLPSADGAGAGGRPGAPSRPIGTPEELPP
ncbi:TadE family type IV pilus minor pilin [Actinomycetospora termitidis]|uniref:TadE family type IV pilus minor pilin n=1 Tax=Actinomycetospora termitidis TaxID=3053470 RepID=A0ABT7M1G6_9PSEU|nr:TadE family type IV pilus minor pilin [Actinomycetospora sp. Odt1-22]MDL5154490.1 TadE family type IV pilus minor pilin [Actinomycetospora sp. Odt1-22]